MADIFWPETLPAAGALGFTGGPQANVASFEPEIGPSIVRRRSTGAVKMYPITLSMLNLDQYNAFVEFFHATLKDGTLPFVWVNPMTSAANQKMRFVVRSGSEAYQETRLTPNKFKISFSVMLLQ